MNKKFLRGIVLVAVIIALIAALSACAPEDNNDTPPDITDKECEHIWEKVSASSGTCVAYGHIDYVCAKCGATKSESDNTYTQHNYANHVCTVCGARQDGEQKWTSGDVTVYLYVLSSTVSGDKTYNLLADGTGKTDDYAVGRQPWAQYCPQIRRFDAVSGVTNVGKNFLYGCDILTDVVLSSEITEIGAGAFGNCPSLEKFSCGDKIVTVGAGAFSGCSALKELYLPASATKIAEGAFSGCVSLRSLSVGLPGSTGNGASAQLFGSIFGEGSGAQTVTIGGTEYSFGVPDSLSYLEIKGDGVIPDYALKSCASLQTVTVSGAVTEIGNEAFSGMDSLTSVKFTRDTLVRIGDYAFSKNNLLGDAGKSSGDVSSNAIVLPSTLTELGEGAFSSCPRLASVVFSGEGLKEIPVLAFGYCSMLVSVKLPESVEKIGSEAFRNTGLKEIVIGKNVTTVGSRAFDSCTNLATVYVDSENVYAGAADSSGLFAQATAVYVLKEIVPDGTAKDPGNSYIKSLTYKGLDPNGYHLWEK